MPVARNPHTYLWDGVSPREAFLACRHDLAYCAGDSAYCGAQAQLPGYALVNKLVNAVVAGKLIGSGHDLQYCAGDSAYCASGGSEVSYVPKQYVIPTDTAVYPHFLYIGGATFPGPATVSASRRDELENLCLKLCPTEQWLGMLVNYA